MERSTDVARIRPAAVVVTGLAAVASAYVVYSAFASRRPTSILRRRDAVRRPRRPLPEVLSAKPCEGAPLGSLIVKMGEVTIERLIGLQPLPTVDEIRSTFNTGQDLAVWREGVLTAMRSILEAAMNVVVMTNRLNYNAEQRALLVAIGLEDLVEGIATVDFPLLEHTEHTVAEFVGLPADDSLVSIAFGEVYDVMRSAEEFHSEDAMEPRFNEAGVHVAGTESLETTDRATVEDYPNQGLRAMLYFIAEERARHNAFEHRGVVCEECGKFPIRGDRWHCLNCPDFDLCSLCEQSTHHHRTHVLAKIKIPIPFLSQPTTLLPIWYAGDPRRHHDVLDYGTKKRLAELFGVELPDIDALYDQFCCSANVPWTKDPLGLNAAIDRRTFTKAFTNDKWPGRFAPNVLYDRMFALYDTNADNLIGFEEFVSGVTYCRKPRGKVSSERAIRGFDINNDGFVDRGDFLRLLRAKYDVHKLLVKEEVENREREQTMASLDHLSSNQPISIALSQEGIPLGAYRIPLGKVPDNNNDMRPMPGVQTILGDDDPWQRLVDIPAPRRRERGGRESRRVGRFEEVLDGMAPPDTDTNNGGAADETQAPSPMVSAVNEQLRLMGATTGMWEEVPFDRDALWQVEEEGLNQLLDRLFKGRERFDEELSVAEAAADKPDPTLPQNRPNSIDAPVLSADSPRLLAEAGTPSVAVLESAQRELRARGGPGRLSCEELEAMVDMDKSKELSGLVFSWIEWASF